MGSQWGAGLRFKWTGSWLQWDADLRLRWTGSWSWWGAGLRCTVGGNYPGSLCVVLGTCRVLTGRYQPCADHKWAVPCTASQAQGLLQASCCPVLMQSLVHQPNVSGKAQAPQAADDFKRTPTVCSLSCPLISAGTPFVQKDSWECCAGNLEGDGHKDDKQSLGTASKAQRESDTGYYHRQTWKSRSQTDGTVVPWGKGFQT